MAMVSRVYLGNLRECFRKSALLKQEWMNMDTKLRTILTKQVQGEMGDDTCSSKITVVGCGQVGMACVASCLLQGVTDEVCVADADKNKLHGEVLDLQHGSLFMRGARVLESTDYHETAGSKVCIVTAGARQKEGESRLSLISRNVEIFKDIIPNLVKYSPDTVLLIVSNPVDVLTWLAWKISGLPMNRVIGSGTNLDTSRFRYLLAKRLNISVTNIHAWIIGEHGDSSVACWSGVNVAGVPLRCLHPKMGSPDDPENWAEAHKKTIESAYKVIKLKGYTSWAIGLSAAQIANAILRKKHTIHPISTNVKDMYGVENEVFCSVPCVLGGSGIASIVQLALTEDEQKSFQASTAQVYEIQRQIKI